MYFLYVHTYICIIFTAVCTGIIHPCSLDDGTGKIHRRKKEISADKGRTANCRCVNACVRRNQFLRMTMVSQAVVDQRTHELQQEIAGLREKLTKYEQ